MKNKKAIVGLGAVAALLLGVATSTAYLTDDSSDSNVMTVGNVKIEQLEYERVVDEDGKWVVENGMEKIQPYTQNKPIVPAVYKDGIIKWDDRNGSSDYYQTWEQINAPGKNQLFDESVRNVVDKFIFVKNTGRKDAYYRTIVAIEDPEGINENAIHINDTGLDKFEKNYIGHTVINGTRYYVIEYLYTDILAPGAISYPSFLQAFLDPITSNKDVELFGNTFEILAVSQAVQTDGFDSAKEALTEAFGEVTKSNAAEWFGDSLIIIRNGEEQKLTDALSNGKSVYIHEEVDLISTVAENGAVNIDAQGATAILNGGENGVYGYLSLAFDDGATADIKNLNVTGVGFVELGHHGGNQSTINRGTYNVENLEIKDLVATLPIAGKNIVAAFSHYGEAILTDCIMIGTTSAVDGYTAYDAGFTNKTTTTINGGEYGKIYLWEHAHVTINDAEVDTIDTTAIKTSDLGKLTVGSGTTVERINLRAIKSYPHRVIIKAGAKVKTLDLSTATIDSKVVIEDITSVENIINPNGITILSTE